jgi:tRNA(adenine34) deaminase
MDVALEEAQRAADRGDTFVGAVVIKDGRILGQGGNHATSGKNSLKHAETTAIDAAIDAFGLASLAGATLYSTMEPCPYCAWAAQGAKISEVVLGARFSDLKRTDLGSYTVESLMEMTGRQLRVTTGIRAEECIGRRQAWMRETGRII